jgi:predicted N-acetyltransferase YhbS
MAELRILAPDELTRLGEIDRSETIDSEYVLDDGVLLLVDLTAPIEARRWSPQQLDHHVEHLREVQARGGVVVGVVDDGTLIALGAVDTRAVGGDPAVLQMTRLYVSRSRRGEGHGSRVVGALVGHARQLGAHALYISATPTRGTVDAYLRMGARLRLPPDPELFAEEPDDIHLLLPFATEPG